MRGGGLPSFERQEESKKRLRIRWQHYVQVHEERLDV
jgi:hypothetical protein